MMHGKDEMRKMTLLLRIPVGLLSSSILGSLLLLGSAVCLLCAFVQLARAAGRFDHVSESAISPVEEHSGFVKLGNAAGA